MMKKRVMQWMGLLALLTVLLASLSGSALAETGALVNQAQAEAYGAGEDVVINLIGSASIQGAENEDLFMKYLEQETADPLTTPQKAVFGAGEKLKGSAKKAYDLLKPHMLKVAAGKETSTVFTLSLSKLGIKSKYTYKELGLSSSASISAANDAAYKLISKELEGMWTAIETLMLDCPYEMYWFDKTAGASWSIPGVSSSGGVTTVYGTTTTLKMYVAAAYANPLYYTYTTQTSTDQIETAKNAVKNAKAIVKKYAGLNDYDKVRAYLYEICDLVSYNYAAVYNNYSYGDPWQLIYAFDGDTSTNIVCEGYSKAFQYLCDLSKFDADVCCYTVYGDVTWDSGGGGAHMWNFITMDNGKNYLVDATACDSDWGVDEYLFLKGAEAGSGKNGYALVHGNRYVFDTITAYSNKNLTLCTKDYTTHTMTAGENHVLKKVKAYDPTCTVPGAIDHYACTACSKVFANRTGSISTTKAKISLDAVGHKLKKTAKVAADCVTAGNKAYWTCSTCGKVYSDSKGVNETTVKAMRIAPLGHTLDYTAAVAPDCTTAGNLEYWHCTVCDLYFADAAAKQPTTKEEMTLAALGHNIVDGLCTVCGVPAAPSGAKASVKKQVTTLTWNAVPTADSYSVYNGTKLLAKGVTDTTYKYTGQSFGKLFNFTVVAVNAAGESAPSAKMSTIVLDKTASLTVESVAAGAKLTWKKVTGASGYKVLRDGVAIKNITSGSTLTFTDTGAPKAGKKCVYSVYAISKYQYSTLTVKAKFIRLATMNAVTLNNNTAKKLTITWKKATGADRYEIYCSTSSTKPKATTAATKTIKSATTLSLTMKNPTVGKTYYVYVRPSGLNGSTRTYGEWTPVAKLKIVR
ncbi:MAG: hypothetical protein IJ157_08625 [Clostridia bacterium]|nr:hypothetical protein [Clostridia bacterium]